MKVKNTKTILIIIFTIIISILIVILVDGFTNRQAKGKNYFNPPQTNNFCAVAKTIYSSSISEDGQQIALLVGDSTGDFFVFIFDKGLNLQKSFSVLTDVISNISFQSLTSILVGCSSEKMARLYDISTGNVAKTFSNDADSFGISVLGFSTYKIILIGGDDFVLFTDKTNVSTPLNTPGMGRKIKGIFPFWATCGTSKTVRTFNLKQQNNDDLTVDFVPSDLCISGDGSMLFLSDSSFNNNTGAIHSFNTADKFPSKLSIISDPLFSFLGTTIACSLKAEILVASFVSKDGSKSGTVVYPRTENYFNKETTIIGNQYVFEIPLTNFPAVTIDQFHKKMLFTCQSSTNNLSCAHMFSAI